MTEHAEEPTLPSEPFSLAFDERGLLPVIAQEETTGEVLLLAYMNAAALHRTLVEGRLVLWSRSRRALWRKGERSGNVLHVRELRVNCEGNTLLARVHLEGAGACHEGYRTCFYRTLSQRGPGELQATVREERVFDPDTVYATPPEAPTDLDAALERDARALYAAYERLRDEPTVPDSRTAVLLHAADPAATARHAVERAREELEELRGVLAGTHGHVSGERDVVLEAGQVGYWAQIAAISMRQAYDAWQPHGVWHAGWTGQVAEIPPAPQDALLAQCASLLLEAAALCRAAKIHPARVVAADLEAMRERHGEGRARP